MKYFITSLITISLFLCSNAHSHNLTAEITGYDGTVIAGYVDGGAYINFTGPSVAVNTSNSRIMMGMLPSLRIKKDEAEVSNSIVTPNLGFGITYSHKRVALQVPVYYNPKTPTQNGNWNIGFGVGIRL